MMEQGDEVQEFVVMAMHFRSKKVLSPFIVPAKDEVAARRLCQRTYLVLQSVKRYECQEGDEKPQILLYGPPISDRDFERDYWNRPADTPKKRSKYISFVAVGFLFLGLPGALIGWFISLFDDSPDRDE
jgi:hypothetical protein